MAERPIFIPAPDSLELVQQVSCRFAWHPGLAPSQKKKNIKALHKAGAAAGYTPLLEISTKSDEEIGQRLSAFHLKIHSASFGDIPLESAFQGSKVFASGGPYEDLYQVDAGAAKRDPRLQNSGPLLAFRFENVEFPLEPKTVFYDWLYVTAIFPHREWLDRLNKYEDLRMLSSIHSDRSTVRHVRARYSSHYGTKVFWRALLSRRKHLFMSWHTIPIHRSWSPKVPAINSSDKRFFDSRKAPSMVGRSLLWILDDHIPSLYGYAFLSNYGLVIRKLLGSTVMVLRRLMVVTCVVFFCLPVYAGEGFQPVSPEELKLASVPEAPGAAAVILYRQSDRDDYGSVGHGHANEYNYFRIKILTEEGRKYADVEIPFFRQEGEDIVNVKARTIKPDGSIITFDGKIFDKTISKAKGLKYLAKTFTLPDVQVGSVIEYYYTEDLAETHIYNSHWVLSNELFIKHAKFSLKPFTASPYTSPNRHVNLQWSWQMLPAGSALPKEGPDGIVRLEVNNIPAFRTEDYMPPPTELMARVDFTYSDEAFDKDPVEFWKKRGKRLNDVVESFVGKRQAMEAAVAQIASPNDAPEVKLQKIYARVQQMRNTSYEPRKSEEERNRENEKPANNVEDVWTRGYGTGMQLTWLFLGLARAAGLEAYAAMVSERRNYFFNPKLMNARQLDANVVLVKLNGKNLFFDPGAAFTPYGMLMWQETGVQGLRLDKDGGTWIQTTVPPSSESRIERRAAFTVSETGDLEGKLTITFTGLEAMRRRVQERNEDDVERKKLLEEQAKEYIPASSEIELKSQPAWNSSSTPLVADFEVKVPGWTSPAGRRMLLSASVFGAAEKHVFEHTERTNAIYFEYPSEEVDDVTITLPQGWQVGSLPPEQNQSAPVVGYTLKAENDKQTLHLTRKLRIDAVLIEPKYYGSLRSFFQAVRKGDEQQIVLQPAAGSSN